MLSRRKRSRTRWAGGLAATFLMPCLSLSCGDGNTGPCPTVPTVSGVILVSHGRELYRQTDAMSAGTITVREGDLVHAIACTFLDADGHTIVIGNDCQSNSIAIESGDPAVATITRDAGLRFFFNVSGVNAGSTLLALRLVHETSSQFTALPVPVVVTPLSGAAVRSGPGIGGPEFRGTGGLGVQEQLHLVRGEPLVRSH